jgi:general L-amino acid transport system permease protein
MMGSSAGAWIPWLILAFVVAIILFFIRRRQIVLSERPGNPWLWPLLSLVGIGLVSYVVVASQAKHPDGLTVELNGGRGRITTFIDLNGNGEFDKREEQLIKAVPVRVESAAEVYEVIPDNRVEVGTRIDSGFRFPRFTQGEFESADVSFVNSDFNGQLAIHFIDFPSIGQVYSDRNSNGVFDKGEELRTPEEIAQTGTPELGYEGDLYKVKLAITGFKRVVVTDFEGQANFPDLESDAGTTTILKASPLVLSRPTFPSERTQVQGGFTLTNAYISLLLALVFYTASFIAEIVRGGILAVPKGQREASKALGLSNSQTFRLVIFPQAMRVIVPPLISQFLNLTKNSSLGFFAAYNEFFKISEITANQTGASVPIILFILVGYLLISLTYSLILNIYNSRVQLVER